MDKPTIGELFDLSGRTALITGASGWLGNAMASALAEAGASVVVGSRDAKKGAEVLAALPSVKGARHHFVVLDQLDPGSIASGFADALSSAGQVDILVNNGHGGDPHDLTDVSPEQFAKVLGNATGWFLLARCLRDHLVARGAAGSIINIGSMYGQVGSYPEVYEGIASASPVSYHTLKGGIIHMTRHLAVYWAKDHVRVNCLSPGPFPASGVNEELVERLKARSPMGRMGLPHELKGALLLFASDAGSYITGQNLTVDGGWTAW